jgi:hypothetical protein
LNFLDEGMKMNLEIRFQSFTGSARKRLPGEGGFQLFDSLARKRLPGKAGLLWLSFPMTAKISMGIMIPSSVSPSFVKRVTDGNESGN